MEKPLRSFPSPITHPHHPSSTSLYQLQRHLVLVLGGDREAALLENSDRGEVALGGDGDEGALRHEREEVGQGAGGDAAAPERPAQPIADFAPAVIVEEAD